MLSYITYYPVLSGEYIVAGCTIDFNKGSVNISAVGYSDDTAKLSDIPYDWCITPYRYIYRYGNECTS